MIEGKTKTGYKFSIDERILNDWRLLSAIALSESTDPSDQIRGAHELVSLVLGEKEKELLDFIAKKNDGYVPTEKVTEVITDILTSVRELKNSQSSEG